MVRLLNVTGSHVGKMSGNISETEQYRDSYYRPLTISVYWPFYLGFVSLPRYTFLHFFQHETFGD